MTTQYTVIEMPPSGSVNEKGERHYVRRFQVTTTNPLDGPKKVAAAVNYTYYESYPYAGEDDPYAILKRVDVQPTDTLGVWNVVLDYDSAPNAVDRGAVRTDPNGGRPDQAPKTAGEASNQQRPESRPWVLKWGSAQTEKLLRNDRSGPSDPFVKGYALSNKKGKLVATSAGQLFDPPISIPEARPTLSITAYSSFAETANIPYWVNRVNHAKWLGWPRDCARVTSYAITSQYEQNSFFWQIDVEIQFNIDGWNPVRVLDAGTFELKEKSPADVGGDGKPIKNTKLVPILNDRDGTPVTTPVPRDGFGKQQKDFTTPLVFLEFQGYYRGNFRSLLRQDLGAKRKPRD